MKYLWAALVPVVSTRLSKEQDSHISNTYFLTGNLLSILFAMTYAWIVRAVLE